MATNPGILTDWPWKGLGNFKYIVLAPFWAHTLYSIIKWKDMNLANILIMPTLLLRMLHNQIWISFSRYRTAEGTNRIVDRSIEFEQVDRERNWDDQILFNGLLFYFINTMVAPASTLPIWRSDGAIMIALIHTGPVEFLYYWFHRALHHHFLYSRYHSHHHSSIVTEPITSVIHPFAEHIGYYLLFSIPTLTALFTGTLSLLSLVSYITYLDFMNNMGHCNFELIPKTLFSIFAPLKYFMYTPSYHSLHHTQFRTNYCLFMPLYDYIYGTVDKSSEQLYEASLKRKEEFPDVIHLTHLTSPFSFYHMRLGFASMASHPFSSNWHLWVLWPLSLMSMTLSWVCSRAFVTERNCLKKFKLQTWTIPRYNLHYCSHWQRASINHMIEEAILEAEEKGCKVLSLGLSNHEKDLNDHGEIYIQKHPNLKVKVVDGSSLAVAVVLNHIPRGTSQVVLLGKVSKVAYSIVYALCVKGIKVAVTRQDRWEMLYEKLKKFQNSFFISDYGASHTWLVCDELAREEQLKALKGTTFIPYSSFPPKRVRKDCIYCPTPALMAPMLLENVDSCENWLPRRAMSAPRVAGIVHALEGWNMHECGATMFEVDKVWNATLRHGFKPLMASAS